MHSHGRRPHRGEHAELRRTDDGARLQRDLAGTEVLAPRPYVAARVPRVANENLLIASIGILDADDAVGTRGNRSSRHDADGRRRCKWHRRSPTGRDRVRHAQRDRRVAARAAHVHCPHRVAIHRGIIPRWER